MAAPPSGAGQRDERRRGDVKAFHTLIVCYVNERLVTDARGISICYQHSNASGGRLVRIFIGAGLLARGTVFIAVCLEALAPVIIDYNGILEDKAAIHAARRRDK